MKPSAADRGERRVARAGQWDRVDAGSRAVGRWIDHGDPARTGGFSGRVEVPVEHEDAAASHRESLWGGPHRHLECLAGEHIDPSDGVEPGVGDVGDRIVEHHRPGGSRAGGKLDPVDEAAPHQVHHRDRVGVTLRDHGDAFPGGHGRGVGTGAPQGHGRGRLARIHRHDGEGVGLAVDDQQELQRLRRRSVGVGAGQGERGEKGQRSRAGHGLPGGVGTMPERYAGSTARAEGVRPGRPRAAGGAPPGGSRRTTR